MQFDIHKVMFEIQKAYNHTFIVRLKNVNADCRFKNIGDGNIKQLIVTLYFNPKYKFNGSIGEDKKVI